MTREERRECVLGLLLTSGMGEARLSSLMAA